MRFWPRPALLISSTPKPRTTSRPSTEKLRSVAPTSVTTARRVPEMISYCSPVGGVLTNRHFIAKDVRGLGQLPLVCYVDNDQGAGTDRTADVSNPHLWMPDEHARLRAAR